MLCDQGWCRTSLPREFYDLEVPISVYEKDFEGAFKALKIQALADGYILSKSGKKKPYTVTVTKKGDDDAAYTSCVDSTVHIVPQKFLKAYLYADSLKCSRPEVKVTPCNHPAPTPAQGFSPPGGGGCLDSVFIPLDRFRVNFYVVSSTFLDSYGVDWVSLWASGNLWSRPSVFSDWALKAVSQGDTLSEFRSIEIDIDSVASLHWGSQKKEEKSTYQTGEVVRTDYEYHDYGLTIDLSRTLNGGIRGSYSLAQRDDMNSIIEGNFGGGGSDSVSTFGVFDSYQFSSVGIPILSSIPVLGVLFSHRQVDKIKSFFVIEIVQLKKVIDDPSRFAFLDSLKQEELNYDVYDSTENQSDTLSDSENAEVLE